MREIKFRYTYKRENGHTFSRIFTLEQIESGEVRQWWELNHVGKSILHKDQYTGLKDKNGVEIYEGDIVKTMVGKHLWWYLVATDSNFGGNNLYLITRYRNFRHVNAGEDIEWGDFFVNECRDTLTEYNASKNLEVIGNIYENPELQEKK